MTRALIAAAALLLGGCCAAGDLRRSVLGAPIARGTPVSVLEARVGKSDLVFVERGDMAQWADLQPSRNLLRGAFGGCEVSGRAGFAFQVDPQGRVYARWSPARNDWVDPADLDVPVPETLDCGHVRSGSGADE